MLNFILKYSFHLSYISNELPIHYCLISGYTLCETECFLTIDTDQHIWSENLRMHSVPFHSSRFSACQNTVTLRSLSDGEYSLQSKLIDLIWLQVSDLEERRTI